MLGDNAKWCWSLDNGIQAQVTISMCRNRLGPTIIIPHVSMENGGSFVWRILCRSGIQQILWMSNGSLIQKFPTLESHFSEISKPAKQFFFASMDCTSIHFTIRIHLFLKIHEIKLYSGFTMSAGAIQLQPCCHRLLRVRRLQWASQRAQNWLETEIIPFGQMIFIINI